MPRQYEAQVPQAEPVPVRQDTYREDRVLQRNDHGDDADSNSS